MIEGWQQAYVYTKVGETKVCLYIVSRVRVLHIVEFARYTLHAGRDRRLPQVHPEDLGVGQNSLKTRRILISLISFDRPPS